MISIKEEYHKWIWAGIFVIMAVLCFTLIHDLYANWGFVQYSIQYLDNKSNTILALTGASTSASVAITMIPGDIGTPIASELANISSYSILLLAAVHLEKYLITLAGEIAFRVLLPVSLIVQAVNLCLFQHEVITSIVKKICAFSCALILVVPASVYMSTMIEKTYSDDVQLSIEQTQKEAEEIKQSLQGKDQSIVEQIINTLNGGAVTLINEFENSLNNFIEAISVMLITACALPILTFMFLIWLIKNILRIDMEPPAFAQMAGRVRINPALFKRKPSENDNE